MLKKLKGRVRKSKAFTLVELIVVIAILMVLSVVAIVAYDGIQETAKIAALRTDANALYTALVAHDMLADAPYEGWGGVTVASASPWWDGELILHAGGGGEGTNSPSTPAAVTAPAPSNGVFTFTYNMNGAVAEPITVKMSVVNARYCLTGTDDGGTASDTAGAVKWDDEDGWSVATDAEIETMITGKTTTTGTNG